VTLLIDEPRWWFRDRHWSHLASDTSLEELHAFARAAGIPARGFHDDHYDVPEEWYEQMLHLGAVPVTSRELVRRLHEAGLRRRPVRRRATTIHHESG